MKILSPIVNNFRRIAEIESPSGHEKKIAKYLMKQLKEVTDFSTSDKYGNIYAFVKGIGEPIFLAAHMDTVEPTKGIKTQVKDGFVLTQSKTVLGADNKVAIACIIELLKHYKMSKTAHRPIEVIFTRSEEVGNYGAINFDYKLLKSKIGYCFDVAQPVGTIILGSPYYERFDIRLIGKEAHAGKPEEAINVLLVFRKMLNLISLGKIDTNTVANIGVVRGGHVRNTVPGELILQGEVRSFIEEGLKRYKFKLLKALKKSTNNYKATYKIELVRENPGYKHTNTKVKKVIQRLRNTMKEVGVKPVEKFAWGVSDANIFNDKKLICVNSGYGAEFTHTIKERIKISYMENLLALMIQLVKS